MPTTPAALTPQTRARLSDTIRNIECIGGEPDIAEVLSVLLAESARADAALNRVEHLEGRVTHLETALDNLMQRLADAPAPRHYTPTLHPIMREALTPFAGVGDIAPLDPRD